MLVCITTKLKRWKTRSRQCKATEASRTQAAARYGRWGPCRGALCHIVSAIGKGKSFDRMYLLNSIWDDDSPIHSKMYREFQTLLCAKGFGALMARQAQQQAITQRRRAEAPLSCVLE